MGDTVCMRAHAQMLANKAYAAICAIGQGMLNSPDHIRIPRICAVCMRDLNVRQEIERDKGRDRAIARWSARTLAVGSRCQL